MSAKKTPWFDGSLKPVRVGEYEKKFSAGYVARRWWNGSFWLDGFGDRSFDQHSPWRGLAQDPKGTA